ncbi:MAG: DUF1559 domain-containing protein [Fimbriimonadaceae bacterium]|jgi:prepilin-type N-terminal cleavage/methylation domain-containing protein/prepilin-type processing-associated H-X9-DG protein|nr:DUF1559 domain-containing protein [Fimbriimonadaceae bacterium]
MKNNRAFTLIELLVVIAIIAILAAILFPVFAQAKAAAKTTSAISNMKQLGTAIMIYSADFDDVPPNAIGSRAEWGGANWCETWALTTQPYVKNLGIFRSPMDGKNSATADWTGVGISFAPNAVAEDIGGRLTLVGMMGYYNVGDYWFAPSGSMTAASKPAETILLAERHNDRISALGSFGNQTVWSSPFAGVDWLDGWLGPAMIPDGTRAANIPFPRGRDGAVTSKNAGKAIFLFADGHVKNLSPVATNPDPVNRPADNLWNSKRD